MKTLKKIAVALLVTLGIGMLASCEFSTFGMQELSASDVTTEWVKGKWEGKSATFTLENGSLKKSGSDESVTFDCDNKFVQAAFVITLKGAADLGELYADSFKTHLVYKIDQKDDNGKVVASTRVDLKKKN